jgi:hypothetical protein
MFSELSKDKSLLSILAKADLDTETKILVKENATPFAIKESLVKNMDSSNLVQYRRYIEKAQEEIRKATKEEEEAFQIALGKETGSREAMERVVSDDEEGDLEALRRDEYKAFERIYNSLDSLKDLLPNMKNIAENIEVARSKKMASGYVFSNALDYNNIQNKTISNSLYNFMNLVVNYPKNLERLSKFFEIIKDEEDEEKTVGIKLTQPVPPADTDSKGRPRKYDELPEIDVLELANQYLDLAKKEIEVGDESLLFIDAFKFLHANRFGEIPTGARNKNQDLKSIERARDIIERYKLKLPQYTQPNIFPKLKQNMEEFGKKYKKHQDIIDILNNRVEELKIRSSPDAIQDIVRNLTKKYFAQATGSPPEEGEPKLSPKEALAMAQEYQKGSERTRKKVVKIQKELQMEYEKEEARLKAITKLYPTLFRASDEILQFNLDSYDKLLDKEMSYRLESGQLIQMNLLSLGKDFFEDLEEEDKNYYRRLFDNKKKLLKNLKDLNDSLDLLNALIDDKDLLAIATGNYQKAINELYQLSLMGLTNEYFREMYAESFEEETTKTLANYLRENEKGDYEMILNDKEALKSLDILDKLVILSAKTENQIEGLETLKEETKSILEE